MTVIDLLILGVVGYALVDFTRARRRIRATKSRYGFVAIVAGLSLVGEKFFENGG